MLKSFKHYVGYLSTIGTPVKNQDWLSLDSGDFDDFRIDPYNCENTGHVVPSNPATNITTVPSPTAKVPDKVKEFKKGVHRDSTLLKQLHCDTDFQAWRIHT